MLATLTVADRLTLVQGIGTPGEGGTLAGLNVHPLPAGALAYVAGINRFYELRKDLDAAVVPDAGTFKNVVASVGSSHTDGYWVACSQMAQVTLVGGEGTVTGFDFTRNGRFFTTLTMAGGSIGEYVLVTPTTAAAASVQSENADDASTYFILYVETP